MSVFNPIPKEHYDVSILEQNIEEIRNEYVSNIKAYQNYMDSLKNSITPSQACQMNLQSQSPDKPLKTIKPIGAFSSEWTSSWIAYNNEFYEPVKKYFPKTYEILNNFGNVFYAHFSELGPGAQIETHIGNEKSSIMRSQWCFISPKESGCYIGASKDLDDNTECEIFNYTENSSFWFDDSKWWHFVRNETQEKRVVLLIDYWTDIKEKQNFDNYIYYNNVFSGFNL